jgi:SAM-dependent methyltransferase
MASDGNACPLCRCAVYFEEAPVDLAAVRKYWRGFQYDLDADFSDLPPSLAQRRCAGCGLHWFVPSLVGRESLYARLNEWPPYYRTQSWEWTIAIEILLRAGIDSLIEIGAGRGDFLALARRAFVHVDGLEFNQAAIDAARARGLPVANRPLGSIAPGQQAVVAFQVLEHVADPAEFLAVCVDRLGPGGVLIVAVPNQDGAGGALANDYLNRPPHHATLWRKSCFEAVARIHDLKFIDYRCEPLGLETYRFYLQRHLRAAAAGALHRKLANRLRRHLYDAVAPFMFELQRATLMGPCHLAAFRKSGDGGRSEASRDQP